ncbi:bifunctional glycosyltransferase family 2/GtrA family protein [Desulfovibrio sp. Huiquan2017]|uniref:bifunctional glycosyltransferase family 2/GtrA family protein n=1 Tax=Desulfovibrio sp. Huiquan2017 TaxID=2816861 RepID=UPI001A930B69|nr:bifunctional glycosyltransferase family 2/GtrA family protein [Desulfovibrio sp. Huiquan2017]
MESICPVLSLVIPCYNEEGTLAECIRRCLALKEHGVTLELIIVDDHSSDNSLPVAQSLADEYMEVTVVHHEVNRGKGAALRTGFSYATGDFVGIQDADKEYDPLDYLTLLKPLQEGKADVVYGSRYLRRDVRRVLYFWHTWMNNALTFASNMFTNLDISDMETCYKLFKREAIKKIVPMLKEDRFGFEPEVTAYVGQLGYRVYECAIHYSPRTYEEGKKIGWKDGARAFYCILHYSAHTAPLPMQILLYFFIGCASAIINVSLFCAFLAFGLGLAISIGLAFILSAATNYLLCITILFRHKARWSAPGEMLIYIVMVAIMCCIDYAVTYAMTSIGLSPLAGKVWASFVGFGGNFILRKYFVFPGRKMRRKHC